MKRIKRRISQTFSQIRRSQTVSNNVAVADKQTDDVDVRWYSSNSGSDGFGYYYGRIPRSTTIAVGGSSSRGGTFCDALPLPISVSGDFAATHADGGLANRTPTFDPALTPTGRPTSMTATPNASGSAGGTPRKDKEKKFAFARVAAFLRRGMTEKRSPLATASPSKPVSRSRSASASNAVTRQTSITAANNTSAASGGGSGSGSGGATGSQSRTPRGLKADALETVVDTDDVDAAVDDDGEINLPPRPLTIIDSNQPVDDQVQDDSLPPLNNKEGLYRPRGRTDAPNTLSMSISMHEQLLVDRWAIAAQDGSHAHGTLNQIVSREPAVKLRNTFSVTGSGIRGFGSKSGENEAIGLLNGKVSRRETRASMYEMGYGRIESYLKLERLGEGTYATVFKGKSLLTNALVALKEIRLEHDEGAPCTAIREVSLLRQLKHANIVTLHDIVHTENALTLVFEYVGKDLKQFMEERHNLLHTHNIKLFLFQLLRGLHFCHQRNILHRDLKPQNLLISPRGELKLADFGLARAKSIPIKTYSHEVVTLWYRPPDILLGSTDYSTPIDMWGVGCILYEMATGRPMFPGTTVANQLNMIFRVLGTPNESTWPGIEQNDEFLQLNCIHYTPENIQKLAPRLDTVAVDLLLTFLRYEPSNRVSAETAMRHRFFESLGTAVHDLRHTDSIMDVPDIALKKDPGAAPIRGTSHVTSVHQHARALPHSHSQFLNASAITNTIVPVMPPAVAADPAGVAPSKLDSSRRQSMLA